MVHERIISFGGGLFKRLKPKKTKKGSIYMNVKYYFLLAVVVCVFTLSAHAEEKSDFLKKRRGLITSSTCPFNCRNLNLPSNLCKDWQSGNTCYVEDFTQVPGHRSMIRIPTEAFMSDDAPPTKPVEPQSQSRGRMKSSSQQGSRRGLVTSAQCPYSCRNVGVSKNLCREWSEGTKCFVEDLTQVPGHRSLIRVPLSDFAS